MQDGSRQKGQGVRRALATNSFTYDECLMLANILTNKLGLITTVIQTGVEGQWRINIWKKSMPLLFELVSPYAFSIKEMLYKIEIN